jgi:hypothetical protein
MANAFQAGAGFGVIYLIGWCVMSVSVILYWEFVYGWTLAITQTEIDFPDGCGLVFAKNMKNLLFAKCFEIHENVITKSELQLALQELELVKLIKIIHENILAFKKSKFDDNLSADLTADERSSS